MAGHAVPAAAQTISGAVFEDVNYGGGAGRDLVASSGVTRSGARVELYDAAGAFTAFTTTDALGAYSFGPLAVGSYTVRVVNASVGSSRAGFVIGLLPVQTFRTDASSGGAVDATDFVGGQNPTVTDAGNGGPGTVMNTTTGVFTAGITGTAQSIANVTLGAGGVTGVDFGFNFNTIVNVNDAGQGSLREFLINSNALGNAGLAIEGQTPGKDVSIFMISDGLAHPGLRAGLPDQLSASGVAVIVPTSALPAITATHTTLDGTTQTANVGDTNAAVLGSGGTVGVDALALPQVSGPEVEIRDGGAIANGIRIQGDDATVRGLAIVGFGTSTGEGEIRVANGIADALIEQNVLGSAAAPFSDPGAGLRGQAGVHSDGGDNGTIRGTLIGFNGVTGIYLGNASTGWSIDGNEIRDNGLNTADGDGITINASSGNAVTGNLVTGTSSQGIVMTAAGAASNTLTNNTVTGNGVGIPLGFVHTPGITLRSGAASTLVDRNVVRANYGAGIQVNNGATGGTLTRNAIADNGTIPARDGSPPTGQIGIDLNSPTDNIDRGTAPFYTLNDPGDADGGGNGLLNYPILLSASLSAGNLILQGFARPGSLIELFIADPDPSRFGEGETYLLTLTEGGSGGGGNDPYPDTDGRTGTYGPGPINGFLQGTDTTNRFAFTFPAPGGVSNGTWLTATATLAGNTSEFGGIAMVSGAISGTVYEDVDFTGTATDWDGGVVDQGLGGVDVEIYDGSDAYVASVTTAADGTFLLGGVADGTYKVRVRSATIGDADTPPRGGLNASVPAVWPYPLAEMTWANGSAVYGGQSATIDDTATGDNAGPGDTFVTITVNGGVPVTGVNCGFAYNLIVNAADDGNADNVRSRQGSLRQFIKNANAIGSAGGTTANSSQFRIPAGLLDGDGVAVVAPATALPQIGDAGGGATVDGSTQTANIGDTNASGPEVAIDGSGIGAVAQGLWLRSAGNVVRGLAIRRFGVAGSNGVWIDGAAATSNTAAGCYIGTNFDGTADLGNSHGVSVTGGASSNAIGGPAAGDRNVIAGNDLYGVRIDGAGTNDNAVLGNYVGTTAGGAGALGNGSGIGILSGAGGTRIGGAGATDGNLIGGNAGDAIHLSGSTGASIQRNLIGTQSDGTTPLPNGRGIRLDGGASGHVIGRPGTGNTIAYNAGAGISLLDAATDQNFISANSIFENGALGIDLGPAGVGVGDGTNDDKAAPAITAIVGADGSNFAVFATAAPGDTVEFYRVTNPAAPVVNADPTGSGEGYLYLGRCVDGGVCSGPYLAAGPDGDPDAGEVQATLLSTAVARGDLVTATAAAGSGSSEFATNAAAAALSLVKRAFQPDGTPLANGAALPAGTLVKYLLYVNNPAGAVADVSVQDVLDPAFGYVAASMRIDASTDACVGAVCTPAEEAAILAAAEGGAAGTDAVDGDVVSVTGSTLDAGNQAAANAQLDIAAGKVWAIVFTVKMN
jgi:parallel beta-helix repeat protein